MTKIILILAAVIILAAIAYIPDTPEERKLREQIRRERMRQYLHQPKKRLCQPKKRL